MHKVPPSSEWVMLVWVLLSEPVLCDSLVISVKLQASAWELTKRLYSEYVTIWIFKCNPITSQLTNVLNILQVVSNLAWLDFIGFMCASFEKEWSVCFLRWSLSTTPSPLSPTTARVEQKGDLTGFFHTIILIFKTQVCESPNHLKSPCVQKEEAWGIVSAKYQEYQIALIHPVLGNKTSGFFNQWFKTRKLENVKTSLCRVLIWQQTRDQPVLWQCDTRIWQVFHLFHPGSCCSLLATLLPGVSIQVLLIFGGPTPPSNLSQLTGLEGAFPPELFWHLYKNLSIDI